MFLGESDLLTDLLALMCYQNYRFPVELQLGSQRCVFDCRLEQHQREGKRDSGIAESQRSSISSNKSHIIISLWSRQIQWMAGTELRASHPLPHTFSVNTFHWLPLIPIMKTSAYLLHSFRPWSRECQWCAAHVDIGIRHVQASQST